MDKEDQILSSKHKKQRVRLAAGKQQGTLKLGDLNVVVDLERSEMAFASGGKGPHYNKHFYKQPGFWIDVGDAVGEAAMDGG